MQRQGRVEREGAARQEEDHLDYVPRLQRHGARQEMSERPDPLAEPAWLAEKHAYAPGTKQYDPVQAALDRVGAKAAHRWRNDTSKRSPAGICDFWPEGEFKGHCTLPSSWLVWLGCEYGEHISPSEICDTHKELAEKVRYECAKCFNAGFPGKYAKAVKVEKREGTMPGL
jgi:hypothetical protein